MGKRYSCLGVAIALAGLFGCGGGSSRSSSNPPVPSAGVSITVTPSTVTVGQSAILTWSSTNSTACTASTTEAGIALFGSWTGSQNLSGTQTLNLTAAGNLTYALSCQNSAGVTASKAATLTVNAPPLLKPSSYENKNETGKAPVSLTALGLYNAFAVADFFNDGSSAVVFHTLEYDPNNPATYQSFGHIYFYKQGPSGAWSDLTSTLLANNTGCIHPRKAVVADFNRDGRPDVYFACHGIDAPPFPGEQPHVLLSQADGTYSNVVVPVTCFCHSASAADVNGDGYPDVLVTDTTVAQTPFFLMNNGDGTFTPDYSRLPTSLKGTQIFTAELIDFSGSGLYDVFLAGNEPGTTTSPTSEFGVEIFPNDGKGSFISTSPVNLLVGSSYGLTLDVVFQNSNVYLLKVNPGYTSNEIQKISYPAVQGNVIYSHSGIYPNGRSWLDWILPYNGNIVSENASYAVSMLQ